MPRSMFAEVEGKSEAQIKSMAPEVVPLDECVLWSRKSLAQRLDISTSSVSMLVRENLIPDSIMVGGSQRWRADEVRQWIAEGCPDLDRWQWEPAQYPKFRELIRDQRSALSELSHLIRERRREVEALEERARIAGLAANLQRQVK